MATVVIGFVVGFALGGRSSDGDDLTATGPSSTTSTAVTSTTTDGSTTSTSGTDRTSTSTAPSSTSTSTTAPSSTSTSEPVATTEPTTTAVVPFPTIPTTVAPVTTAPPPAAPSRVVVSYASDGRGRLVIPRGGSAGLTIGNEGGLAQQWLVTGTGFTIAGPTQGTLGPGQYVTVTLLPPPGELPLGEINGIVSVLGAINPTVAFVIPPA